MRPTAAGRLRAEMAPQFVRGLAVRKKVSSLIILGECAGKVVIQPGLSEISKHHQKVPRLVYQDMICGVLTSPMISKIHVIGCRGTNFGRHIHTHRNSSW